MRTRENVPCLILDFSQKTKKKEECRQPFRPFKKRKTKQRKSGYKKGGG